jgi:hypothetical protein
MLERTRNLAGRPGDKDSGVALACVVVAVLFI